MSSKMVLGSNIENIYSLTPVQEGMLFHKLMNGDSTAYVVQHRFELNGLINEQKVKEAIQLVTMKHDVLRTSIVFEKLTVPRQIILKNRAIEYERIDLSDIEAYDRNNKMEMIAQLDVERGFDLQRDSLLRVKLVHFGANQYKMLWTFHHIIIDGWSLSILFSDFKTYYDMLEHGKSLQSIMSIVETDKKSIEKYGDYVKWLEQQNAIEGIAYWEELLSDYDGAADIKSTEQTPLSVETVSLSEMKLSKEQTASLQNLAATHHITMNTIVETAWGIVLQLYTGAKDVVYGKVISGRHVPIRGIEKIVGPFIVTIPARTRYKEDDMVVEVLHSTQLQGTKSTAYSYCSLQQIMSLTKQKSELIKYLYAFENYELDETLLTQHSEGLGLKIEAYREQTNYDLVLIVNYEHGYLRFQIQYASNRYGSKEIEAMLLRLQVVLLSFANNPEMKLSELEMITEEEKAQILGAFNDTSLPYAKDKTIPALWEEQVANTPDAIAVVYEDNQVTYDALNRKINQVAWALRRLHIQPDDRVVIVAERSVEMIAGMYGIIKAGAAYVPLDPTFPAERIQFILNDCKPKAVLVYQTTIETDLPTINLADDKLWEGQSDNPEQVNRPDDLAYIIYTSGTTGQPKGVMLAHSGVVAMRSYLQEKYEVTEQDNVLQFANYVFDASVWEMTLSLLLGAKLTLVSQAVLSDVSSFNAFIKKNGITLTLLPPQYYLQTDISGLRVLTTGGSAANAEMIEKAGSGTRYINAYGPTESTVLATGWEYDGESDIPYPVPIGKPTSNTQIYIMDGMKLCGIGVPGELCIAGSGVAKGYLNLPELTAEKFIENPYGEGKLYRSGDLAKWLPDGNIAYLGRIDDQVKIRGFRIEPGEVENALRQLEGIQDAAVIVQETHDGEKALFAYLISKDQVQLQAVRRDLEEVLPAYMVPAYMMQIDQLPVTRNGKLDKRALPEIAAVSEKEYTAPKNELEAQLCNIFSEVLGVERVGTQDSFFELGGDSIKAIRIVSKLRSAGYHIAIKDIMQKYTVEAISYAAQKSALEEQYEQDEVSGLVPLTPIVREFASWNLPKPHHFNQDMLMEIDLEDEKQLRKVLDALMAHHDILRSVYREGQLEIVKVSNSKAYELKVYDFSEDQAAELMEAACTELHSSINLEEGPLVKAAMFRTGEGNLLFVGIHHLVVDGVSWRILQEDISTAIQQVKEGTKIRFPAKTASYKAWAEALVEYKDSPLLQKERAYWEQVATQMVAGELRMDEQTGESGYDSCTIHLNKEETEQLIHQAGRAYHTEINDLLISALGMAVQKLTGARDVTIGMEGHGREPIHKRIDIDRTVGWFTSIYPVVVPCHEEIAESIITTKEVLRKIPNRGLGYGLLQDELPVRPLEVMFNYMGQMDAEAKGKKLHFFSSGKGSAAENTVFRKMIINGGIMDGKLQLVIGYNRSYLSRDRMQSFSERYRAALLAIKDHCIAIKESVQTPSDYRAAHLTRTDLSVIQQAVGGSSQIERIYGLTSLQTGMLYHSIAEPESTAYRNQNVFIGQGYADESMVKQALNLLAMRHEVLRTAIIHKNISMPKQVVIREREVEYERTDLTGVEAIVQAEMMEAIAHGQIQRGFDLAQDPLLRVHHVVLSKDRYQLIWDFHHIIMDGWSLSAVYGEFNRLVQALQKGALPSDLKKQVMKDKQNQASYEDYIVWLEKQDQEKGLSYWSDVLAGYEEVAEIKPVYTPQASEQQVQRLAITLTPEDRSRIKELTSAHQMTVSNVVETAWGVVLQAYSGQKDVVFGKVTSGRQSDVQGIEDIVGLFINTIPVRVASKEGMSVMGLLKEMQQQGSESEQYAYCSLAEIQAQTEQKQHLIQVLYVFENYYVDEDKLTDFTHKIVSGRDQNQYNLTLCAYESGEKIVCEMLYNPNVYTNEDIVHMLTRLEHVLHALAENPEMKLSELETTTEEEKEQILGAFQTKPTQYPHEESIKSLFEAQVKKTPHRIAVSCGTEQLTYAELNAKANIVANRLLATKAKSETGKGETMVALLLERNIDMVIGILGVVKAGYVYVPIDPEAPQDRIQYTLADSGASLLLVNQGKEHMISLPQGSIYAIEHLYSDETDAGLEAELKANPDISIAPQDALYIIYTSGTTGEPKGTIIEHECVVRLMQNDDMPFHFHEEDVWSLFAAYNFDVSVWEMYGALLYGGHLVVIPNDAKKDSYAFLNILREKKVTVLNQVPSSFYNLMQVELAEAGERLYVKHLIFAGEALQVGKLKAWHAKYPEMNIVNMYGITETTVHVTYKAITAEDIALDVNDVGKALPTLKIYMLDGDKLCGIGVPGELCVAGVGVARGYLNKPELTNKKFVENPFVPGERMYRSGDLAKWLPDGNIAYLGRIDDQVKIRGFRIELGEVENALRQLAGIQDAAVIVRETHDGEKALFAYLISKDQVQLQAVRRDLEEVLPAYMVPAYMMQIDELPVTRNGKLDKRALPEIVAVSEKEYTAPKNELEAQLCDIFSEVLGVERVGTQDSFFELGGDSIKAIRIVSKLRSAGYHIAIKDIMQKYTVEAISYAAQKSALEEQYEQDEVSGLVPLTPIVREFASWNLPKPHHFNQDMLMEIDLEDEKQLRKVLDALIAHHDMLRSIYREGQLEIVKVSDSKAYELKVYDFSEEQAAAERMEAVCTELHSSIDLEEGPLVKAAMFRTGEGNLLFLGIHHLVVDGVSWRILQEDIGTAIQQVKEGTKIRFPAKTASYKAWAEALAEYKDSHLLQKERAYWEQVATQMAAGELRMDEQTGESGYGSCTIHLNKEETAQLIHQASRAYNTEINDLLISALGMTVKKLTGARDVTIGMEGHGREPIHKRIDIDRTVGWFTSIYPVVVPCHEDIAESIITTKEMLRKIPNRGLGYGLLQDELPVRPLEVMFNYMGQMDAEAKGKKLHFFSSGKGSADENTIFRKIIVNGGIMDGKLQLAIGYNRSYLSSDRMQSFSERYMAALLAIKDHCIAIKESVRTPSDYRAAYLTRTDLSVIQQAVGGSSQIERIYGLTSLQKGMLYHSIAEPESTAYRNQNIFIGQGYADEYMVKQALNLLAIRHEVLRTAIIHKDISMPRQVVIREREVEYERTDLTGVEAIVQTEMVEAIAHGQIQRGFDLAQDPLLRVHHVVLSKDCYQLIWNFHHIIMDGWCLSTVYGEFNRLYKALQKGALTSDLKKQVIKEKQDQTSYEDYIVWLEKQDQEKGLSYWSDVLAGYEEVAEIKPVYTPQESGQQVQRLAITLTPEDRLRIKELTSAHQMTVSNVVETAWGVVLQAYSGQKDVVFGKVTSGRQSDVRGIEDIVGLFINTIPVRVASKEGMSVMRLLKEMQQQGSESEQYAYCSLAEIQAQTEQKQHLIQVLYAFENYYVDEDKLTDFTYEITSSRDQPPYNLTLCAYESGEKIVCEMLYNPNVYANEDIVQMLTRLEHVIHALAVNPEMKLSELETITEEEKERILGAFNDTSLPYAKDKTIPALWEEQVAHTPDAIAVVYEDNYVTYDALNRKINQVARALRRHHIEPDDRVVIVAERSVEMIAGMYGIIKAGGAYVPVDPTIPAERMRFILNDCKPKAVLVYNTTIETDLPTINLADDKLWEGQSDNPEQVNRPDDLAYIIYTSGTTGQPKGVMLAHSGVVAMRSYLQEKYEVAQQDNVLQFANYVFDASVWEMTLSLLLGAKLTLVSQAVLSDVSSFNAFIKKNGITLTLLPPQYYLQTDISGLRVLTTGGSAANAEMIEKAGSGTRYINAYGPTESTVLATGWEYDGESDIPYPVPIGKPTSNTQIYIMDGMKLCGIGVPGELCIAGSGVAKGYLNLPELTAEKFIENPYGEGKLYRSGDLAKWLPDGNITYLGRIDDQVKIRGFRIEPGEVENALRQLAGIQDAVVVATNNHEIQSLCGYIVSHTVVDPFEIKQNLKKFLPSYMIPSFIMQLEQIPVTSSGKVDKHRLPSPNVRALVEHDTFVAAQNDREKELVTIWRDILVSEQIGIYDNFFELGGNSLLIMSMLARIEERYPGIVKVGDIFANPTIAQLATFIDVSSQTALRCAQVPFPDSYLLGSRNKVFVFHFQDNSDLFHVLKEMQSESETALESWLLFLYTYSVIEATGQQELSVCYGANNTFSSFEICNHDDLNVLLENVNSKKQAAPKCTQAKFIIDYKQNGLFPMFLYQFTGNKGYTEYCDFSFSFTMNEEAVYFEAKILNRTLNSDYIQSLFLRWIQIVQHVSLKDKDNSKV